MRVFLLCANLEQEPYLVYPLGMSTVAAALRQHGHEVLQASLLLYEHNAKGMESLADELSAFAPGLVGISLRNVDNVDSQSQDGHWSLGRLQKLVAYLRTITKAPIILGGSGFSLMPEAILEYTGADYGLAGEGDIGFPKFVRQLEEHGSVPCKLSYGERPDAASFVSPHRDLLPFFTSQSGVVNLQSKRGCNRRCAYCTYPQLEGRTIRCKEPEQVIEEIRWLQQHAEFSELFFTDSVFNDNKGHWIKLLETMVQKNVVVPWVGFFQPDGLSRELLALCKRTGLKAIEFGTDAGCDATLKALSKGFTFAEVLHTHQLCKELAVPSAHFVILGGPGETDDTLQESLANLSLLDNAFITIFWGIRIYPETPLVRKLKLEVSSFFEPVYYVSEQLDPEASRKKIAAFAKGDRLRIFPPEKGQARMRAMQQMGYRGILWDTLIKM